VVDLMRAPRVFFGQNDVTVYLRRYVCELHRGLKPTGSVYLHCDPTASHCIKLVLDVVLGLKQFKNEII